MKIARPALENFRLETIMIQCKDCEFYRQEPDGRRIFLCDPFNNIKETECIAKWQLLKTDLLLQAFARMNAFQSRMGPLQDKIFKYIKREIDDIEETDSWKYDDDDIPEPPQEFDFPDDQNPPEDK